MKPLLFSDLLEANRTRHVRFYAPGQAPWRDLDWVVAIGGEVGEALNLVKKLNRDVQGMGGNTLSRDVLVAALGDELADVVIYAVVVAGLKGWALPWTDFRALRRATRRQHDHRLGTGRDAWEKRDFSGFGTEVLWWVGHMANTEIESFTPRLIEGLLIAVDDLADLAGIDLGRAVIGKFNATSEKLGFPERLAA